MDSEDKIAIAMIIISFAATIGLSYLLASCGSDIINKEIEEAYKAMEKANNGAAQTMDNPWCYECKEKCYERKEGSMYHCFHCGKKTVIWDNDYSFEDYCLEGEGIVHELHCTECGATITYFVGEDDADLG